MTYAKTKGNPANRNKPHQSDGSELIPAEVQAKARHDVAQTVDDASLIGYTVDDEGLINNYAIEPDISASAYPSLRQQRRYVFLGIGAALFVVILTLIAFAVS